MKVKKLFFIHHPSHWCVLLVFLGTGVNRAVVVPVLHGRGGVWWSGSDGRGDGIVDGAQPVLQIQRALTL